MPKTLLFPLRDNVVVRPVVAPKVTEGGIHIPDEVAGREKPVEGVVIAVGPGVFNDQGQHIPVDVKIDDRVLFGKYGGTDFEIDGEMLKVMTDDQISLVIRREEEVA